MPCTCTPNDTCYECFSTSGYGVIRQHTEQLLKIGDPTWDSGPFAGSGIGLVRLEADIDGEKVQVTTPVFLTDWENDPYIREAVEQELRRRLGHEIVRHLNPPILMDPLLGGAA